VKGDSMKKTIPMALAGLVALSACTAAGGGHGIVTGGNRPAGEVRFEWQTHGGATARLVAVLPDGERFEGPATSISSVTEPGVGFLFGGKRPEMIVQAPGKLWTGEIEAVLTGDRGRSMDCRLREKKAGMGFESGASGSCQISDGRRIAATF
jgi:hypothetical protein